MCRTVFKTLEQKAALKTNKRSFTVLVTTSLIAFPNLRGIPGETDVCSMLSDFIYFANANRKSKVIESLLFLAMYF